MKGSALGRDARQARSCWATAYAQTAPAAPDAAAGRRRRGGKSPSQAQTENRQSPKRTNCPSVAVVVTNSRKVALTELDGAISGHGDSVKILGAARRGQKSRHPCRARQTLPVRPARRVRRSDHDGRVVGGSVHGQEDQSGGMIEADSPVRSPSTKQPRGRVTWPLGCFGAAMTGPTTWPGQARPRSIYYLAAA